MQPQVIIISGDLRDRNDLKSKVSTSEELYDFSKKLKITSYDVFWQSANADCLSLIHLLF